jgi:hypothetical protein
MDARVRRYVASYRDTRASLKGCVKDSGAATTSLLSGLKWDGEEPSEFVASLLERGG